MFFILLYLCFKSRLRPEGPFGRAYARRHLLSLTPNFSWVTTGCRRRKNRFNSTVLLLCSSHPTSLAQGVNGCPNSTPKNSVLAPRRSRIPKSSRLNPHHYLSFRLVCWTTLGH